MRENITTSKGVPGMTILNPTDRFCTLPEVAKLLAVSIRTARNLIKVGLPALKIGGNIRCYLPDVVRWAKAQKFESAKEKDLNQTVDDIMKGV